MVIEQVGVQFSQLHIPQPTDVSKAEYMFLSVRLLNQQYLKTYDTHLIFLTVPND